MQRSKKGNIFLAAFVFAGIFFILAGGCDNFMLNDADSSFKKAIEDEVWEANAPELTVRFQNSIDNTITGTISPAGSQQIKQKVAAPVIFQEASGRAFIRWAAYRKQGDEYLEAGNDVVVFTEPESFQTDVLVQVTADQAGELIIAPITVTRPIITNITPNINTTNVLRNNNITITFTDNIDEYSFKYNNDTEEGTFFSDDTENGHLKNITILKAYTLNDPEMEDVATRANFNPTLEGRQLILRPRQVYPAGAYYTVMIDSSVYITIKKETYNTQTDKVVTITPKVDPVIFQVGSKTDQEPPEAVTIVFAPYKGDPTVSGTYEADDVYVVPENQINSDAYIMDSGTDEAKEIIGRRRVRDRLVFAAKALDDTDSVNRVQVSIQHQYASNGEQSPVSTPLTFTRSYIETQNQLETQPLTIIDDIDLSGIEDGVLEVTVKFADSNENWSTGDVTYYIIKDTTPPGPESVDFARVMLAGGLTASEDWFSTVQPTAKFSDPQNAVQDMGIGLGDKTGVPRTRSEHSKLKWSFSLVENGSYTEPGLIENSPHELNTCQAGIAETDGSHYVYVKLTDDLGNASGPFRLGRTIKKDATPPSNIRFYFDEANPAGTYPKKNGNSRIFRIAADDATSGVEKFTITITGPADPAGQTIGSDGNGVTIEDNTNNTHALTVTKTLPSGSIDPGAGDSGDIAITLNGYTGWTSDGQQDQPASGNYSVSVKVIDQLGNSTTQDLSYFYHDSRKPVVDGFTVLNGTAGTSPEAYSRTIGNSQEYFITGEGFRVKTKATDKAPDTNGSGVVVGALITESRGSNDSGSFKAARTAIAAQDGLDIFLGSDSLTYGTEKYMRFNMFFKDNDGNYVYYPSADDGSWGGIVSGTTTGIENLADGSKGFGGNDFYVYRDNDPPAFNGAPALTGVDSPGNYSRAVFNGESVVFFKGSDQVKLDLEAADQAVGNKASGLKNWSLKVNGGAATVNSFAGPPEGDTDPKTGKHTRSVTEIINGIKNTDTGAGLSENPALTEFSSLTFALEDQLGNISAETTQFRYGDGSNTAGYFILDSTAPSFGTVLVTNDPSDPMGINLDGGSAPPAHGGLDYAADYAANDYGRFFTRGTVAVRIDNVVERGAGVKTITLRPTRPLDTSSVSVKVNGQDAAISESGGIYTVTLGTPLRSAGGAALIITGLRLSGATEGGTRLKIEEVKLGDAVSNLSSTGVSQGTGLIVANTPPTQAGSNSAASHGTPDGFYLENSLGLKSTSAGNFYISTGFDLVYRNVTTGPSGLAQLRFASSVTVDYTGAAIRIDEAGDGFANDTDLAGNTDYWWSTGTVEGKDAYYVYFKLDTAAGSGRVLNSRDIRISGLTLGGSDNDTVTITGTVRNFTGNAGQSSDASGMVIKDTTPPSVSALNLDNQKLSAGKNYISGTPAGTLAGITDPGSGASYQYWVGTSTLPSDAPWLGHDGSSGNGADNLDASETLLGSISLGESTTDVPYVVYAYVRDRAGNVSAPASIPDLYVDNTGPAFTGPASLSRDPADNPGWVTTWVKNRAAYTVQFIERYAGISEMTFDNTGGNTRFYDVTEIRYSSVDNDWDNAIKLKSADGDFGYSESTGTITITDGKAIRTPGGNPMYLRIIGAITAFDNDGSTGSNLKMKLASAKDLVGNLSASPANTQTGAVNFDRKAPEFLEGSTGTRIGTVTASKRTATIYVKYIEQDQSGLKQIKFLTDGGSTISFDGTSSGLTLSGASVTGANTFTFSAPVFSASAGSVITIKGVPFTETGELKVELELTDLAGNKKVTVMTKALDKVKPVITDFTVATDPDPAINNYIRGGIVEFKFTEPSPAGSGIDAIALIYSPSGSASAPAADSADWQPWPMNWQQYGSWAGAQTASAAWSIENGTWPDGWPEAWKDAWPASPPPLWTVFPTGLPANDEASTLISMNLPEITYSYFYVYLQDRMGNVTERNISGANTNRHDFGAVRIDKSPPAFTDSGTPNAVTEPVSPRQKGSTGNYYAKGASVTFAATDTGGVAGIQFAVTTANTPPDAADTNAAGINGWAAYSGGQETVDLSGFGSTTNIKTVYVHVKDALGNTPDSGPVQVTVNASGSALYIDSEEPAFESGPTLNLTGTAKEGATSGIYYIKEASVTFEATDVGIEAMQFAVTTTNTAPSDTALDDDGDGIGGWAAYSGGQETVDLSGFGSTTNIKTVYVYVRDVVGNILGPGAVPVNNSGSALYIDSAAPDFTVTPSAVTEPVSPQQKGSTGNYYAKEASVTFAAADTGVAGIQFAVTTTDTVPAVTAPNGIGGWADYSGGSKTVDLSGFTAPDNNIKTVYVHVKDALGNTPDSGPVPVTVNDSGSALYIDVAEPTFTVTPGAVTDPVSPQRKGSTNDYYVKGASVTFTATDVGVEAMQFAVTTTDTVPAVTAPNGIGGWAAYSGGQETVDLSGFGSTANIKTVYVHVRDVVGNTLSSGAVTVNNSGDALYIDSAAPVFESGPAPGLTGTVAEGATSGNYYVKGASVTFEAADTGVAGIQFAVTTANIPPDAADTNTNGINGWAAYSGDSKTVDLSGFTAPDNNIKTVYVHVKDVLGNIRSPEAVTVNNSGTALYIDSAAPTFTVTPNAVTDPVSPQQKGSTNDYYVKEASVTFTATDVGVEAMQFAVTTTDIVPAVTAPNGIKGWADYSGGSKTVDLAGFTAPDNNIKTVYVHVKDALGNIRSSGAVTVNNSGTALYIDSAAPTFTDSGTPGAVTDPVSPQQKGSTSDYYVKGASVTFTAADTGVAGMQFAVTIISTPPDAADTAPNGIKGWAAYSGDSKTVDLSGFTAPDNNIKTVYVHVKDALGHTVSSGEVPVYVGGDLYIDSTAPVAVPSAVLTTVVDNTSYYTVSNAKIKFTPSDGGVGGIEYAVLSSVGTPSSWTSYDPVDGEVEEDLSVFTENIQNVYLYLKDALGNEATTPKTVYTAGPLYIDITPPVVSGSISIDPVTGELTGITIGDGTGNVAGFDETLLSGNYNLISSATGAGTPTLTFSGDYSITGGTPSPLPVTGTEDYTITLTVKDKGGVEQDYTIGITFTAADGTYTFTTDGAWVASGEPIIPSATMVPFGFASPGFLPGNVPAAASGGRAPAPVYGSIGGVRYPLAGLTTAARVPARPSSAGQSAAGVSYSYRSEDAEYLHSYGVSARNPGSSGGPVSVTVVSEPASLRRERPNRAQTAPRNAPQDDDSAYTEDLAAEDSEFEDYGLSLSALPADSPVPVDSPPDNRVPFRNSNVDPFILPPQADGSGSRAKGLRGTDDDEEE